MQRVFIGLGFCSALVAAGGLPILTDSSQDLTENFEDELKEPKLQQAALLALIQQVLPLGLGLAETILGGIQLDDTNEIERDVRAIRNVTDGLASFYSYNQGLKKIGDHVGFCHGSYGSVCESLETLTILTEDTMGGMLSNIHAMTSDIQAAVQQPPSLSAGDDLRFGALCSLDGDKASCGNTLLASATIGNGNICKQPVFTVLASGPLSSTFEAPVAIRVNKKTVYLTNPENKKHNLSTPQCKTGMEKITTIDEGSEATVLNALPGTVLMGGDMVEVVMSYGPKMAGLCDLELQVKVKVKQSVKHLTSLLPAALVRPCQNIK
ncbi:unnamed protein product [Chrysoparadoxa australica]